MQLIGPMTFAFASGGGLGYGRFSDERMRDGVFVYRLWGFLNWGSREANPRAHILFFSKALFSYLLQLLR